MTSRFMLSPVAAFCSLALTVSATSTALTQSELTSAQRVVKMPVNTEQVLVQKHFVFSGLSEPKAKIVKLDRTIKENKSAEFVKDSAIRFVSGKHYLTGTTKLEMDRIIGALQGKQDIKLHFIGHADSQRLSANAKKIYKTNQGLSEHRANIVAAYFREQLGLTDSATTTEGRSNREPIASNSTLDGMARNRRVEVIAIYTETRIVEGTQTIDPPVRTNLCGNQIEHKRPLNITLDGEAFDLKDGTNNADNQRCADMNLAGFDLQLKYDPLNALPKLHIQHALTKSGNTLMLNLKGYSNYHSFFDYAEVQILAPNSQRVLAKVALDESLSGRWRLPSNLLGMSLQYRFRVYNKQGRFDETSLAQADFRPRFAIEQAKLDGYLMSGYGQSMLAKQNIKLQGGTLTLYGRQVPLHHRVYFLGRVVAVNRERKFVHQQIVASGFHRAEVALLNEQGQGHLIHRDLALPTSDWFYVAMADLTIGQNSHNGPVSLLSSDHNRDGNLFAEGRLSGYITGKWQDEYQVTARIDTREQPLNKLLSGLHEKDPKSLFRRLEEEQYPTEYGDDSTVIDDAPSNGKVYLKVEKSKSHILWGNFHTRISDTELARVERGLYGLQARYDSESVNLDGESNTQVQVFAAQAETLAAYESHRATGGSLYYLQHQDIVQGSEQVAIEVRDKVTGLVLVRRNLAPGQDYDIDALQGRVLLTRPLSSFEQDDLLVRTASLDSNPVFLIAQYEYTPGIDGLDNLTYGARFSHWLNDKFQLGTTISHQEQAAFDDKLLALDATYRASDSAYVKLEVSQSEGVGNALNSFNGGINFAEQQSSDVGKRAQAKHIESAFELSDLGLNEQGKGQFYWQQLEAGFNSTGKISPVDTRSFGSFWEWQVNDSHALHIKIDVQDAQSQQRREAAELGYVYKLNNNWLVSSGIRQEKKESQRQVESNAQSEFSDQGLRTDAVVQLEYKAEYWQPYVYAQGTLTRAHTRDANNRMGVGAEIQVSENIAINAELSDGNLGEAGKLGANWQYHQDSNVYVEYRVDPDGGDVFSNGKQKNWVTGTRHRFNSATSVYAEQIWLQDSAQTGLTHAYGIEHHFAAGWQAGLGFEVGELEQGEDTISRDVTTFSLGYQTDTWQWRGALEYREDENSQETRTSWLTRQNVQAKINTDWRAQLRFDWAKSDSSKADSQPTGALNSDYTEAQFGIAYRPVGTSPWSGLASFTFLEDLAPASQLSGIGLDNTPQQRSKVWMLDVDYQLTERWRLGTKLAQRVGEVRLGRDAGEWVDSTATLGVFRADYHMMHHWDATIEWRNLAVDLAQDSRSGALLAVHRHVGEHMKLGIGYNFTNFSDDLTDLDYDSKGWFLNLVGKF
ncbi:OmpA family protein [Pseudoalteromonas luteoviolacea]|uniref:OmpA-like domain-containing protein n=1 Tax=Pseudoalteromonas luteoviolacea DSM 6061 TaxID=1365250 RepID=A0A166WCW8_9GAMM|nr:OmpA family protein [Pseudoalteromonas luteoviolacea]KZN37240.1 hypothetical protein N475_16225 [Pseudoalteromonas luteoviolacea DSM 6061]MBE0387539.1 hypothetical protein [Pseudoalteromonas luteoviolacea DSM 6061]